MSLRAPRNFDQSQGQVEAMMEQGTAFGRVEDAIDAAQLSAEHKAALWLLAWSLRDHVQQRQDARLMVAAVRRRTDDSETRARISVVPPPEERRVVRRRSLTTDLPSS
jgi:hypothetical protein